MIILIKCSQEDVIKMAKLAILKSEPVGMGFLHYDKDLKEEDIKLDADERSVYVDYYQGRMVKFYGISTPDGWKFNDTIYPSYQSWAIHYPSYAALYKAVVGE